MGRSTSRSSESSSRSETRRFLPLDQTPRFSTLSRSRRSTATISSRSSRTSRTRRRSRSSRTSKVFASEFCDDLTKVSKLRKERRWVRMPGWNDYGDDLDYVERLFMEIKKTIKYHNCVYDFAFHQKSNSLILFHTLYYFTFLFCIFIRLVITHYLRVFSPILKPGMIHIVE